MRIDDHYGMLELPQQGWAEAGLQSCKSAIDIFGSLVPILGPTLSQILDANINTLREERIKKFLQALSEYQEKIPHQILTSEEFTDAIRAGISRYLTEPSEKKTAVYFKSESLAVYDSWNGKGRISFPTLFCI